MLKSLIGKLRILFRRSAVESELNEELRDHIERQTEQNRRLGMAPEDARLAAQKAFGGVEQAKEQSRDVRGFKWLEEVGQDLRYGARGLIKNPSFTLIATITLGLGLGATAAIFSVINGVFLKPMPYRDAERLTMVWATRPQTSEFPVMAGNFIDLRDQNQTFESIAAFQPQSFNITHGGDPEILGGLRVSPAFFTLLGVEPKFGRGFLGEEEQPGASRVVVLSHGVWERRFGSDPSVVGQTVSLNNESYLIVGVSPPGFQFPRKGEMPSEWPFSGETSVYTPLALSPEQRTTRNRISLAVIARLKSRASVEQAQVELNGIAERLRRQFPDANWNTGFRVVGLRQQATSRVRLALFTLQGAVGFVLLIGCANVANLLLVRGSARRNEIALRTALGASRERIIRQLLTESLLLALLGGALTSLLSFWIVNLLRKTLPDNMPRVEEIGVDWRILLFMILISAFVGVLFGLVPALQASKLNLCDALKERGRYAGGAKSHGFRNGLIIAEVALSAALLIGAGLLLRSFVRLMDVDPGIKTRNVLTMDIKLPRNKYQPLQQAAFLGQLLDRLRAAPGVLAAGAVYPLPLSGTDEGISFSVEGGSPTVSGQLRSVAPRSVGGDYFKALQIQVKRGRVFIDRDGRDSPPVLVINEAMAREFWPNENPIGKRISFDQRDGQAIWREIIGVVGDVRHLGLDRGIRSEVYFPFTQLGLPPQTLVVHANGDPRGLVAAIRNEVQAIDKEQPISNIHALDELLEKSTSPRQFNLLLLGVFACAALGLAAVGIYGVMSSLVAQRTHEIGVRIALGAQQGDVRRLVIKRGMTLALVGAAVGLATAFGLTQLIRALLFRVSPADPLTYFFILLLLLLVALAACWIPARRATKVDPIMALRND